MLIDSVELTIKAGNGGNGKVSWRREKYVPKGGPDGGDGGRGGNIVLRTTNNLDTLSSFRYRKVFQAEPGENGRSKKMAGRGGADLELLVPVGTVVTDVQTGAMVHDFTRGDETYLIARGGNGGLGNPHFVSSTHQHPTEFTEGEPGESQKVKLELRLVADVALIGEPNAGKSSLLAALTGVEGRIGAYAFSTHQPVLGVMRRGDRTVTLVDLPGLLAGAHHGRGLGDEFLKHATRVRAILHIVDATLPINDSRSVIEKELKMFDPKLAKLPRQLVINKIDLLSPEELNELKKQFKNVLFVSATTRENIDQLTRFVAEQVRLN
ncbi:MAG TPA: GTPase ObgE [Candidatus Saccharimonadales bacterium]|nr:GTPase ObgE [Candidatus Saccharimonadales bacterium]